MNKLFLCLLAIFTLALSACGTGASVGVGGGGGSYGGGGGIGISFPVGGDSRGQYEPNQSQQVESEEGGNIEHSPDSIGTASPGYIGSNLSSSYPKHNCYQPMKPDPGDSGGQVMAYKQKLDKYRICIDTYAKNAKNDMIDIENKANSALREYRQFVTMP